LYVVAYRYVILDMLAYRYASVRGEGEKQEARRCMRPGSLPTTVDYLLLAGAKVIQKEVRTTRDPTK
jgi:hypothetical protein